MEIWQDGGLLWPLAAFFAGSIPFGLLMGKMKGVDLRSRGSGNIGATNVARTLGKGYGLATLSADIAKGLVPVLAASLYFEADAGSPVWIVLTAVAAVLGHCFSIFLGLRGGKGVATAAGAYLALCPLAVAALAVAFFLVVKRWGYVSAGSITAATLAPILMYVICPGSPGWVAAAALAPVILYRHRENIVRLLKGEEKGWKKG